MSYICIQYPLSSSLLNNTMNFLSNTCKINKMAAVCGLPLNNGLNTIQCTYKLGTRHHCTYSLILRYKCYT